MLPLHMDTVFSPTDSHRNTFLRSFINSFGCSYICLWWHFPHPTHDHLSFLDGYYYEDNNQSAAAFSVGSLSRRLFDEYRNQQFFLVNNRIPGMAFLSNLPYRELNETDLQAMASCDVQRQFYLAARIKTAVLMGCRSGEIEMGWSNGTQVNMENAIRSWFSEDRVSRQQSPLRELSQAVDINRLSSTSSSSLRSLSMDSPESSPLLFNPHIQQQQHIQSLQQLPITTTTPPPIHHQQAMQSFEPLPSTTSAHQAMHDFALTRNIHLPTQESEHAAITRAILAVLTSSPSSSLASSSTPNNLPQTSPLNQNASAFRKYLAPTAPTRARLHRQTMLKRSITYYRSLNIARREQMQANRPTSTQLHHMISERKRREKINESFEALRKLLPPEAKKDKASLLNRTREYLGSLKDQIAKLSERNKQLEAQLLGADKLDESEGASERVDVRITHDTESTSEEQRIINLQVVLRGESPVTEMVIRILEFLRQVQNVNVISIDASSRSSEESRSSNRVNLRLKIEGNDWDESAFQEAIRRVVADLL